MARPPAHSGTESNHRAHRGGGAPELRAIAAWRITGRTLRRSARLKAVVTNNLVCYLQESPLSPEQKLKPIDKDHYRFEVSVKGSWQLGFWILSQGAEIVGEGPKELRERIQENLQEALAGYRAP